MRARRASSVRADVTRNVLKIIGKSRQRIGVLLDGSTIGNVVALIVSTLPRRPYYTISRSEAGIGLDSIHCDPESIPNEILVVNPEDVPNVPIKALQDAFGPFWGAATGSHDFLPLEFM